MALKKTVLEVNKTTPIEKSYINKQRNKLSGATEVGQPGIITSNNFIQDSRRTELTPERRLYTFDIMCQDDAVSNSIEFTNMLVVNALHTGQFVPGNSKSGKSKIAADFLNHCIRSMSYGTWLDFCINAATDLKYGYSMLNLVTEVAKSGPYRGNRVIKKLAPRDQKSVYGWVWDKEMREFQGFIQKRNLVQKTPTSSKSKYMGNLNLLSAAKYYDMGYPFIKKDQLLHFTYNSTNNNPQGDSPLMHCYNAWCEKKLIEKYEIIGTTKGLGGLLLLRIPGELIEKANDPEGRYPEATLEYMALQRDASDLHSAKNSFMVMTSDVDEVTKTPLYDIKFLGVEGNQAQSFSTSEIVDRRNKSIYNTFLTSAILLGQGETGSYALSTSITSMHGLAVENNLLQKCNVINYQLGKRMLEINGADQTLNWDDYPVFEPRDPSELDLNSASSAIQRIKSVSAMTPESLKWFYNKLGIDTEGIDKLDFSGESTSRAGDGMVSAGEGTSTSVGDKNGGDASISNTANKSEKVRFYVRDGNALIDTATGLYAGELDE